MGFRAPEEVPATFLVTNPTPSTIAGSRPPQSGVDFNGDRRDVTVQDIIQVEGRRTPDYTVSQRNFRFGFILVVAQGSEPSTADLAKVETFRQGFEEIYRRALFGTRHRRRHPPPRLEALRVAGGRSGRRCVLHRARVHREARHRTARRATQGLQRRRRSARLGHHSR